MFPLLKDTTNAITHHLGTVGLYVGGLVLIAAPLHFTDDWIAGQYPEGVIPSWYGAYLSLRDLWSVALSALLQAILFARLGADMARPLWKWGDTRNALRRFFPLWLLVNLIIVALIRGQIRLAQADIGDGFAALGLLVMLAMMFLPMIASCLMFIGGLNWSKVEEALMPIVRFPIMSLQVMLLGLTNFLLQFMVMTEESLEAWRTPIGLTLVSIPIALLEIIAFAAMWRICIHHRDHAEPHHDPYDF